MPLTLQELPGIKDPFPVVGFLHLSHLQGSLAMLFGSNTGQVGSAKEFMPPGGILNHWGSEMERLVVPCFLAFQHFWGVFYTISLRLPIGIESSCPQGNPSLTHFFLSFPPFLSRSSRFASGVSWDHLPNGLSPETQMKTTPCPFLLLFDDSVMQCVDRWERLSAFIWRYGGSET